MKLLLCISDPKTLLKQNLKIVSKCWLLILVNIVTIKVKENMSNNKKRNPFYFDQVFSFKFCMGRDTIFRDL